MSSAVLNAWLLLPAKWAINLPRLPHEKTACRADNPLANSTMFLVRAPDPADAGCNSKLAQYSNTPILWDGFDFADSCLGDLLSRRDASDFVPKGLDDRSQAIYCLEYAQKRRTVPEGRCYLGYTTSSPPMVEERPVDRIIPFPTGSLCGTLQAINCLATIIPSLRDKRPSTPVHEFDAGSPRVAEFEDEDDDEDENEASPILDRFHRKGTPFHGIIHDFPYLEQVSKHFKTI